jgi:hypothetical protein
MVKSIFTQGIIAGVLSSSAAIIYQLIYQEMFFLDFSAVVNAGGIIGACMIGCMLMSVGYFGLFKLNKLKLKGWLNTLYAILSFASIMPAMTMTLPLDVEFPELFPGLVVPMHFFPALAFFALAPFFDKL